MRPPIRHVPPRHPHARLAGVHVVAHGPALDRSWIEVHPQREQARAARQRFCRGGREVRDERGTAQVDVAVRADPDLGGRAAREREREGQVDRRREPVVGERRHQGRDRWDERAGAGRHAIARARAHHLDAALGEVERAGREQLVERDRSTQRAAGAGERGRGQREGEIEALGEPHAAAVCGVAPGAREGKTGRSAPRGRSRDSSRRLTHEPRPQPRRPVVA